jgi:alginate production protein
MRPMALAITLGSCPVVAEARIDRWQNVVPTPIAEPQGPVIANPAARLRFGRAAAGTGLQLPDLGQPQLAQFQFQVPEDKPGTKAPAPATPADLTFQYAYGSDSEINYRRDPDLNKRVRDNSTVAAPTLFGLATYRPNAWLEATLEMTLSREFPIQEEKQVVLPSGEIQRAPPRRPWSLLVDQAYVNIKGDPFEFWVGRKNFEDARLWLYDAALDSVGVKLKLGTLQTEVSVGRENWRDMDLLTTAPRGTIDYYILHSEYRGIEDHRFAAYAITLRDSLRQEGTPLIMGARAYGRPTDKFNYWTDLALLRGEDPTRQKYSAWAFDVGGTYRFTGVSTKPSVTLGYAYGSGDGDPNDTRNREFRQTGLQSNEARFGGLTQFKAYGETFDPELSNLKIFTLGFGFQPASNAYVDLVYHKYRLDKIGNDLRSSALTALINQDDTRLSKRVGSEIDVILGFRNLFGLKRLGFEVRAGWFFPGDAYRVEEGDPNNPTFRKADKGVSVLAVFIY